MSALDGMTHERWMQLTRAERDQLRQLPTDPTPDHRLYACKAGGERVKITYPDGETVRCYIGMSTGWRPCFLEIKRYDSTGGGPLRVEPGMQVERVATPRRRRA
jgi:hypothetical protein